MSVSHTKAAAIAGIGATPFSRNSGCSEMSLAVQAITAALKDAGLSVDDVNGLCTFTSDNNAEYEIVRNLGIEQVDFWARAHPGGGGACAPLQLAKMALIAGEASVVVCYRAMNEYSQYRFGKGYGSAQWGTSFPTSDAALKSLHSVHGLRTAAAMLGMTMQRYCHETGATSRDFANVSVAARKHAATNPKAFFFKKPISIEDHQNSKLIAEPFRLLDCCLESDGGVAFVVVSADRVSDTPHTPVWISAASQAVAGRMVPMTNYYVDDITAFAESTAVAETLHRSSGLRPSDIDAAMVYDHFGPTVLPQLERYGFCKRGEGKDFVCGGNIEVGGILPVNTHGGQLGEAYMHGMNGITEAVRQLRGCAINQIENPKNVLVTGALGTTTSAAILSGE